MKKKITLTFVFIIFAIHLQAQTPSINEARSKTFINSPNFQNDYGVVLQAKIARIESNKSKTADPALISAMDKQIASYKKTLADLKPSRNYRSLETYYDALIEQKTDSIDLLYQIIESKDFTYKNKSKLQALDSVYGLIDKKMQELQTAITTKSEIEFSKEKFKWWLPTVPRANRKKFFHDMYNNETGKPILLNSLSLNSNSEATSVQNEIITDNMWAVRLSFGSVLSISTGTAEAGQTPEEAAAAAKKKQEEEAKSRLLNGGGNFYLEMILPLFTTNQNNGDQITSYTYGSLRGAMDMKEISSNIDTSTGNGSVGLFSYLGISSDTKKFNFFFQGNINYTVGTTDFYENLGLTDTKPFLNGKVIAGLTLRNQFRLTTIVNAFGSDPNIRSSKVTVGIQILP